LIDVTVTIDLTQHVALLGYGPPSDGLSSLSGYGWQLCFSAKHETDVAQQYVIQLVDDFLYGAVNNWKNADEALVDEWQVLLPLVDTVPAHCKLRIALRNDESGNVTGVTFTMRDGQGDKVAERDMTLTDIGLPADDLRPSSPSN
jgi:hypothetical protein